MRGGALSEPESLVRTQTQPGNLAPETEPDPGSTKLCPELTHHHPGC